ncbi:unnamed protein product, partial [marine sediment metagenome]
FKLTDNNSVSKLRLLGLQSKKWYSEEEIEEVNENVNLFMNCELNALGVMETVKAIVRTEELIDIFAEENKRNKTTERQVSDKFQLMDLE